MKNERTNTVFVIAAALVSTFFALPTFILTLLIVGGTDAFFFSAAAWLLMFLVLFTVFRIHDSRAEKRFDEAIRTLIGDPSRIIFYADCVIPREQTASPSRLYCLDGRLLIVTPDGEECGSVSIPREMLTKIELFPRSVTDLILSDGKRLRLHLPEADDLIDALHGLGWCFGTEDLDTPPDMDPKE